MKDLQRVCTERGIVLILDEVFVGFRLAARGAQEYFGIQADMVTYGKTIAGGLPVGVLCGRRDLMCRFKKDRPADICFARGTFNSHPYVMTSMQVFLERAESSDVLRLYENLDAIWNERAERMNAALAKENLPARVVNLSTIWTVVYDEPSRYNWMFQFYLRAHELALSWVGTGRFIFSLNYTEQEFDEVMRRFVLAGRAMVEDGWWFQDSSLTNKSIRRGLLREILQHRFGR